MERQGLLPGKGGNNMGEKGQQILDEVREAIQGKNFASMDELQDFVNQFMEEKNSCSVDDFLGFSHEQIHRLLYTQSLLELNDMVTFNIGLGPEAFEDIPVVKNVFYFLSRLSELEPLKATQKGNLPLKFARELLEAFGTSPGRRRINIRSEQEATSVLAIRHILKMCKWIKKEKKHFKLTLRGKKIVARGRLSTADFWTLFSVFTREFNWGFQDRYPEILIVQQSIVFSLYLVHRMAREFVDADEIADRFVRAFPLALEEAKNSGPWFSRDPSGTVKSCFKLRFLARFCEYFDLVVIRREKRNTYVEKMLIKKSDFFDSFIQWAEK